MKWRGPGKETLKLDNVKIRPHELAFDVDGVIADTFRSFVETARNDYDVQIDYDAITDYDFRKVVDIDDAVSDEILRKILEDPLGMGIKPIPGAKGVLNRLLDMGSVLFVTARPHKDSIMAWFKQAMGLLDVNAVRLEATGNPLDKLPVLLENGIKYFVEDRLDTCYLIHEQDIMPIVFEQPWNRKPHPFQTVTDWKGIHDKIDWNVLP